MVHNDALGGGGAAINADKAFEHRAGLKLAGFELLPLAVAGVECIQIFLVLCQAAAASPLGLLLVATDGDVPLQLLAAQVAADMLLFGLTELH